MNFEWSAECGADDPFIEVPWSSEDGTLKWVDLRTDPHAIDEITEADEYPALLNALRILNGPRSPVFTSKCDAWPMDGDELIALSAELLLEDGIANAGFTGYIDIIFRERSLFLSRHQLQGMLHRVDRAAALLPHSLAKLEMVVRHAMLDLNTPQEGFAITLYVKGVGVDEYEAQERWTSALRDVATLIRSLDVSSARQR